jgi:fructose-bisphosphate aldolase class II
MKTLNAYLSEARTAGHAIGHFNFTTADVLRAIIESARDAGAPAVMVGTSEGEAEFIGMLEAAALVRAFREELRYPVFLNADHFKSVASCKAAIDAGYDSVLMDGSKLTNAENIAAVSEVVAYARAHNVTVEGELGYLRGSSQIQETVAMTPDDFTKPEEAVAFVRATDVDRLAVVFGNIHGIVTKQIERLDISHFERIAAAVPDVHLVLHGASGLQDEEVRAAIKAGIVNVHFNTELRVAYARALDKQLDDHPSETTPYKYLAPAVDEVKKVVAQKTVLFMGR